MRFLLRADAGTQTGTGHVMRCLALAEELIGRDHEVMLRGALGGIDWLHKHVAAAGLPHDDAPLDTLDAVRTAEEGWDAVVVDSYTIGPSEVSRLNELTPVLAIIDGADRGIAARRYLDQTWAQRFRPGDPRWQPPSWEEVSTPSFAVQCASFGETPTGPCHRTRQ